MIVSKGTEGQTDLRARVRQWQKKGGGGGGHRLTEIRLLMKGEAADLTDPRSLPLMDVLNMSLQMMLSEKAGVAQLAVKSWSELRIVDVFSLARKKAKKRKGKK